MSAPHQPVPKSLNDTVVTITSSRAVGHFPPLANVPAIITFPCLTNGESVLICV